MFQLILMLAASTLGLSWLVSSHFPPWMSWHSEALAFFAMLLFAWTGLTHVVRSQKCATLSVPLLAAILIALMLWTVLQGTTGLITYWGDVWIFVLYMALCWICVTVGFAATGQAEKALIWLAFVLITGAFVSAVIAWVQVLSVWESTDWIARMPQLRRPGSNLGQPNQLATLLLMGMASLLFLYESGKFKAVSSTLIFAVLGVALAMTESRTGALGIVLLAGWWASKRRSVKFNLSVWIVVCAVTVVLGLFLLWPAIFDFLLQNEGSSKINTSAGSRLEIWSQLLQAIALRPWLGWGLNQLPEAHNAVAHLYSFSLPFSYSHNIVIDLALGIGVPLTLLLVAFTSVWLWRRVRQANQLQPWYCMAVVLPVAVHSMLEFPFTYAYFLIPVMLALGVQEGFSGARSVLKIDVRLAAALLLVSSAMGAWSVVEYVQVEEDFRVARFKALRVGQTAAAYERPHIVLLTQLDALLAGARIAPKPGMNADELALTKKVALRYPWAAMQNRYALSLALNGDPDEAVRQLRVMRAMHGLEEYQKIKEIWNSLAEEKYPQLRLLTLP